MRQRNYNWMRSVRTRSEKRDNQELEYVRAKRRPGNLVDYWDDKCFIITDSWKDKRKTQYYTNGRGKRHEVLLPNPNGWRKEWKLTEYFKENNIPYRVIEETESYPCTRNILVTTEKVKSHQIAKYERRYRGIYDSDGRYERVTYVTQIGFRWIYKDVSIEPYTKESTYIYTDVTGFRVIWWSHKDIGIEYLLNSSEL